MEAVTDQTGRLRRRWIIAAIAVSGVLFSGVSANASSPDQGNSKPARVSLRSLRFEPGSQNGTATVVVEATGPLPEPATGTPVNPPRIFLDFSDVLTLRITEPIANPLVSRLRAAENNAMPLVTRVVIDLTQAVPYRVDTSGRAEGRIVVVLGGVPPRSDQKPAAATAPPAAAPGRTAPSPPPTTSVPPPTSAPTTARSTPAKRPSAPATAPSAPATMPSAPVSMPSGATMPSVPTTMPSVPATTPPPVTTPPASAKKPPANATTPTAPATAPAPPATTAAAPPTTPSSPTTQPSAPPRSTPAEMQYGARVIPVMVRLNALRPVLVAIDKRTLPTPGGDMEASALEFDDLAKLLETLKPPSTRASAHALLLRACTLGARAARLREAPAANPDAAIVWDAASAAAGALMMIDTANRELGGK